MAIKLLKDRGIKTAIITGHSSKVVEMRVKIGIDYYESNEKLPILKNKEELSFSLNEVAYIGVDLNEFANI